MQRPFCLLWARLSGIWKTDYQAIYLKRNLIKNVRCRFKKNIVVSIGIKMV